MVSASFTAVHSIRTQLIACAGRMCIQQWDYTVLLFDFLLVDKPIGGKTQRGKNWELQCRLGPPGYAQKKKDCTVRFFSFQIPSSDNIKL